MKLLLIALFTTVIILAVDCEDKNECPDKPVGCTDYDSIPTSEPCDAYFERWFYVAASNSCEKIGYSGCSQFGFETKEDCEACACE